MTGLETMIGLARPHDMTPHGINAEVQGEFVAKILCWNSDGEMWPTHSSISTLGGLPSGVGCYSEHCPTLTL